MTSKSTRTRQLRRAYVLARNALGHQGWWPAETPFEVCVGAILTQNTNWSNVRRALGNLKAAGVFDHERLYALPENELAQLIRPAGYFNVKARRLRAFLRVLVEEFGGSLEKLFTGDTLTVRERLLAIHGIGPETADSMLLYAGKHLSFVVDSYTRRIFCRHGWCSDDITYDDLRAVLSKALARDDDAGQLDHWQDYHAQLVAIGNRYCRTREPLCDLCPLKTLLPKRAIRTRQVKVAR